jgi:hypothetical protein
MRIDLLKKFVSMREALTAEKATLETRLAQINDALAIAAEPGVAPAPSRPAAATATVERQRRVVGRRRAENQLSLREAVLQVTRGKAMTRQEILEGVKKLGYKFTAKDPLNSLSTLLYTTKAIKNYGGKFGPA